MVGEDGTVYVQNGVSTEILPCTMTVSGFLRGMRNGFYRKDSLSVVVGVSPAQMETIRPAPDTAVEYSVHVLGLDQETDAGSGSGSGAGAAAKGGASATAGGGGGDGEGASSPGDGDTIGCSSIPRRVVLDSCEDSTRQI